MIHRSISPCMFLACVVLLFLFGAYSPARATHLVGGELTYEYIGPNAQGENEFEIHCFVYRDCSSNNTNGTDFDNIASVGVYQGNTLITVASAFLNPTFVTDIIPENPNNCAFLPEDLCIERAEYIISVSLPVSQIDYTVVHQRCCRSPAILNLNIPEDQGFSLVATIPGGLTLNISNSTPVFNELPQAFVCSNFPFSVDNSATDPDGDSLSYSVSPIYLGGTPLNPIPNPPTGPPFNGVNWAAGFAPQAPLGAGSALMIDPSTGVLSATPMIIGKFALGITVTEWRDGQPIGSILRDFTMDVVTCNILSPGYDAPEPCTGLTVNFDQFNNPSDTYVWDFGANDTAEDQSSEAEPSYTYADPGIYAVSLFFETGSCSDSLFYNVVAHEPWNTNFDVSNLVCNEGGWLGELNLDDSNWTSYIDWNWSFGTDAIPSTALNYSPDEVWFVAGADVNVVLESSAFTCDASSSFLVELPDLPMADFEIDYEPCSGLDVGFVNLSPDTGPFSWDFGGGAGLPNDGINAAFAYPAYGTYNVILTAGLGTECADEQSIEITLLPEFPFDSTYIVQPLSQCDDSGFVLLQHSGQGADEVTWDFPGILTSSDLTLQAEFPGLGVYPGTLTLYNESCDLIEVINVVADIPLPLLGVTYQIPNVISPNNDGRNDSFSAFLVGANGEDVSALAPRDFVYYDLAVYNRWGNAMFESSQAGSAWRPRPEVASGTYYVIISARHLCDDAPFNYSGELSLVR